MINKQEVFLNIGRERIKGRHVLTHLFKTDPVKICIKNRIKLGKKDLHTYFFIQVATRAKC